MRLGMLCMAELCEKSEHIRNFVIVIHKAITHCNKAYQSEGEALMIEYLTVLKAASTGGSATYSHRPNGD